MVYGDDVPPNMAHLANLPVTPRLGAFTEDGKARWEQWVCDCGSRLTDTPEVTHGMMATPVDPLERNVKVHAIVCVHQLHAHGKPCTGHEGPVPDPRPPGYKILTPPSPPRDATICFEVRTKTEGLEAAFRTREAADRYVVSMRESMGVTDAFVVELKLSLTDSIRSLPASAFWAKP